MRKSYWKKRQMQRTAWVFYFSVGILAVPCPGWSAGLTPSMSGQELLQYTLDDLRAAINRATGENEKLRERSQGLQEKMNQLKKVHDALADQKKVLMDQAAELRTKAESADREMVTLQEKVKQLSQSAIVRREEVQGLRTDVVAAREVLRDLQQKSPALQKEISEKSQYLTDELPAQLKKQAKEKRARLEQALKEKERVVKKREPGIARLNKEVVSARREEEKLLAEKKTGEQKEDILRARLDALREEEFRLRKEIAALSKGLSNDDVAQIKKETEQLREEGEAIHAALGRTEKDVRLLINLSAGQEQKMETMKQYLEEEKELLTQHMVLLEERKGLPSRVVRQVSRPKIRKSPIDAAAKKKLLSRIGQERKTQEVFEREYASLSRDIQTMNVRADRLRRGSVEMDPQQVVEEKEKIARLLARFDAAEDSETTAPPEIIPPEEKNLEGSEEASLNGAIDDLKLREAVLTSSLTMIEDRFEEQKGLVETFSEEEPQLRGYLETLTAENKGLKEKIAALAKAIKQQTP